MKYADIIANDIVNGENVSVSLFVQGCHKHCPGCFNQETWNFDSGKDIYIYDLIDKIKELLVANGVQRNFSILGGEPFAPENRTIVAHITHLIREAFPDIKIWIWTGYTFEELEMEHSPHIDETLVYADVLVDGPYIESERDLSLPYRGSRNQRIIKLDNFSKLRYNILKEKEL